MKVSLEVKYKTPKGTETSFTSEEMKVEKALLIAEDLQKTGRVKEVIFVDQLQTTWTIKEIKKYVEEVETEPHNITVYFDGGFDHSSRKSGLGCAIYYEQNGKSFRMRKNAQVADLDTNNEAEYAALYFGLQELELLGVHHLPVTFIGDSQVVVNQLKGEWPCMEETLNTWAERIERKIKELGLTPEFTLVTRKKNQEADQLASQALKDIEITSTIEI
ncbi:ribonuclease H family protein [Bacillus sp. FJAT-44742]|uniref:ribonuclease H family protein n=1 Tax=Bacillus sp. FJAT-44742 TaxID=2014005 RepID=UPI000C230786|nr:ribonuclease H family protein [Bacillus sp. FJAT-44742]